MPGLKALVEAMRQELRDDGVEVKSQRMHTWWSSLCATYNNRTKGSMESRRLR